MSEVLDISLGLVNELVAHAVEDFPREACGVLVGPAEECRFERVVRMANVGDGNDRYAFDPEAQLALWLALEAAGERPWGVYRSHPTTRAWPSKVDIATAAYADMLYVIVGAADQQVRAFQIIDGQVVENPLRITVAATPG